SLLTAMIVLDVCMPARCWIAPETPAATYSCGETCLPVWPTWWLCGYQPASTAAREAPTAAPRESANSSTGEKSPAVPRPPETTIAASVSSGRPDAALGWLSVIRAAFALAEITISVTCSTPAPETASGVTEFGLTVMMAVPLVTVACTMKPPANTDWVVRTAPPSPACTSTASVIRPDPVLIERRAAISLPSGDELIRTATGAAEATSAASTSALGATTKSAISADSTR